MSNAKWDGEFLPASLECRIIGKSGFFENSDCFREEFNARHAKGVTGMEIQLESRYCNTWMDTSMNFSRNDETDILDEMNLAIIRHLRENPQYTNADLARLLGVAKTTIGLRVNRLYETGTIRIVGVLDPVKAGYGISAWIRVQVRSRSLHEVAEKLAELPEALTVARCTGPYQIFVSIMARDVRHLGEIVAQRINSVEGVEQTVTTVFLDTFYSNLAHRVFDISDQSIEARLSELNQTDLLHTHDDLDRSILAELQFDARVNFREIARKYDVPESTVRARINRLEAKEEIHFTLATNPEKFGWIAAALLYARMNSKHISAAVERLVRHPNVQLVALAAGHADLVVAVSSKSREELHGFIQETMPNVPGILEIESMEVLSRIRYLSGWGRTGSANPAHDPFTL